jgi:uncharacterized membrane protein YqaE (UPF0057 family)
MSSPSTLTASHYASYLLHVLGLLLSPTHFPTLQLTNFKIAGPGTDCLINTFFFLAGVIPGHIHGFYITCTYFSRKRKVRKGHYPGGKKAGVYSEAVWNGGASDEKVEGLWLKKQREVEERKMGRRGGSWLSRKGIELRGADEETGRGKRCTDERGKQMSVTR